MLTGQILLQLIVILLTVQLCGYLCRCIGQQWVIGEILAGLALGPSVLGLLLPAIKAWFFPASSLPTLQTFGDIGLILYMFCIGARLDTHLMLRQSRIATLTTLSATLLPLMLGACLAYFLFPYPGFAGRQANLFAFTLLVGTAMAITAFPVLARLLAEKNMLSSRIGTLALTCAAAGDVIAWCLLALVVAVIHVTGLAAIALTLGLTLLFGTLMLGVVRPLLAYADRRIPSRPLLITLSMLLLLASAACTNALGIHPVFGAFLMGTILPRKAAFVEQVRSIDRVNTVLFLPLYFVYTGLHTQVTLINTPALWLACLLVIILACGGKILGATLPARWLGTSWRDSLSLGILMNTRGLIELIALNIGLETGVLSPTFFAMLVIMAIATTMMASPLLHLLAYRVQPMAGADTGIEAVAQEQGQ